MQFSDYIVIEWSLLCLFHPSSCGCKFDFSYKSANLYIARFISVELGELCSGPSCVDRPWIYLGQDLAMADCVHQNFWRVVK